MSFYFEIQLQIQDFPSGAQWPCMEARLFDKIREDYVPRFTSDNVTIDPCTIWRKMKLLYFLHYFVEISSNQSEIVTGIASDHFRICISESCLMFRVVVHQYKKRNNCSDNFYLVFTTSNLLRINASWRSQIAFYMYTVVLSNLCKLRHYSPTMSGLWYGWSET